VREDGAVANGKYWYEAGERGKKSEQLELALFFHGSEYPV
jgi:hypothetical protein